MTREPAAKEPVDAAQVEDQPSLPLYIAGLIVTLAGIVAVTELVTDQNLMATTVMLTIIGFVFSVGCRYLKINLHIAELLLGGTALYVIYNAVMGQLDWRAVASHSQADIGVIFAWAMTAWAWALVSDSLVLMCALLSMASIGLMASIEIDGPIEACFLAFLFSSLFLMGQHLYLVKREQAPQAERVRSGLQLWLTQALVVAIVAGLVFIAASALVVPAQMMIGNSTLTQAIQGLVTVSPSKATNTQVSGPNVMDDVDLEIGTGQGWGASSDVVALVQTSDKQPHYWTARTYDQYTGVGWTSSFDGNYTDVPGNYPDPAKVEYTVDMRTPLAGSPMTAEFDIRANTNEFFYTGALQTLTLQRGPEHLSVCPDGHIMLSDSSRYRSIYVAECYPQPDSTSTDWDNRLAKAGTKFPSSVKLLYTNLDNQITTPDDIAYFKQTARAVIERLPANKRSEYDIVQALSDYVSGQAVYNLNVSALPAGTDHVRAFLQTARAGYCDMFASSLAVLVRAAGYPSRVVTGFAPGSFDGARYTLRVMDKHAWTEVYFPGFGWSTFDATIGSTPASAPVNKHQNTLSLVDRIRTFLRSRGPVAPILAVAILLILLYIFKVEVLDRMLARRRNSEAAAVSREEIGKEYDRMVRSIGNLGLRRKSSETPFEFAARAVSYLDDLRDTLGATIDSDAVTGFTRYYTVVRYSGNSYRRAVRKGVDPELASFFRQARRARVKYILRKLRPSKRPVVAGG